MLHFSGVVSAYMKYTALVPPLEFPLEQSQYLIWFLSWVYIFLLLSSDDGILLSQILCCISLKLLSGPRKSFELILLTNQPWAVRSPEVALFPDFWSHFSVAEGKKGMPISASSPCYLSQHPPTFLFPGELSFVTHTQRSQPETNSKKRFWSCRILCVLMQSMVFTFTRNSILPGTALAVLGPRSFAWIRNQRNE